MTTECLNKENTEVEVWFDILISQLKSDQLQIESDVASPEIKDMYSKLMTGKEEEFAEAKVNVKYDKFGFYITSTIIEENDKLNIPSQYKSILN